MLTLKFPARNIRKYGNHQLLARTLFSMESPLKKHHERRLIKYPINDIYEVVADVARYHEFVPWCKASKVIEIDNNSNAMRAELAVGFQYLTERYISNVSYQKPSIVTATSSQTGIFDILKTEWKFAPSSDPNSTWVTFHVEFKFKSALYNELSELFLAEVVKNMVKAFEDRCRVIHNSHSKMHK